MPETILEKRQITGTETGGWTIVLARTDQKVGANMLRINKDNFLSALLLAMTSVLLCQRNGPISGGEESLQNPNFHIYLGY